MEACHTAHYWTREIAALRSSLISAIRAHFAEFGIIAGQRMRNIERLLRAP